MSFNKSFLNAYRVDTLPILLKPLISLYGMIGAIYYQLSFGLRYLTCRREYVGLDNLEEGQNYIFCLWHQNYTHYFSTIISLKNHAWMNHPYWYMKPIHTFLKLRGLDEVVLGSTGNDGRDAATTLVKRLKEGKSTVMAPDGPAGPARKLKNGVLHIAAQADVPIVGISFSCSNSKKLNTWDQRELPRLFSTIKITFSKPIRVEMNNFEVVKPLLEKIL